MSPWDLLISTPSPVLELQGHATAWGFYVSAGDLQVFMHVKYFTNWALQFLNSFKSNTAYIVLRHINITLFYFNFLPLNCSHGMKQWEMKNATYEFQRTLCNSTRDTTGEERPTEEASWKNSVKCLEKSRRGSKWRTLRSSLGLITYNKDTLLKWFHFPNPTLRPVNLKLFF